MTENVSPENSVSLPLVWPEQIDLPTIYANHLYVQYSGNEFFLVFGELQPPVIAGPVEERRAKLAAMSELVVRPVARIVISPPAMMSMAKIIQDNVSMFLDSMERSSTDNPDSDR